MSTDNSSNTPTKPTFVEWVEGLLPFKLPRIPFPKMARNFDKSAGRLISAGFENVATRLDSNTRRTNARSGAEVALIRRMENKLATDATLPADLETRAIQYVVEKAVASQENRERVLELTAEELTREDAIGYTEDARDEIDSDWLNTFAKYAEEKSNEEIRHLWAEILASEIRKPGTCSLRTLDFLAKITSTEASRIVSVFSFTIDDTCIPEFVDDDDTYLPFSEWLLAREIGVIAETAANAQLNWESGAEPHIRYFNKVCVFESKKELPLIISAYPLTAIGKEICRLSDNKKPNYAFFQDVCNRISKKHTIKIIDTK